MPDTGISNLRAAYPIRRYPDWPLPVTPATRFPERVNNSEDGPKIIAMKGFKQVFS